MEQADGIDCEWGDFPGKLVSIYKSKGCYSFASIKEGISKFSRGNACQ